MPGQNEIDLEERELSITEPIGIGKINLPGIKVKECQKVLKVFLMCGMNSNLCIMPEGQTPQGQTKFKGDFCHKAILS